MTLEEVRALLSIEGQKQLAGIYNEERELSSFLLSASGNIDASLLRGLAEQIKSQSLLKKKHPGLASLHPLCEKSLLEQSTAEVVARYRASQCEGESFIDCTGGMGIDTLFLAKSFKLGVFCEMDESRVELFAYNRALFQCENIEVAIGNSIEKLERESTCYSLLFVDPARRDDSSRFFAIENSVPNVVDHWDLLLDRADKVLVKLSPMVDIGHVCKQLSHITQVEVISLQGEVKEVLVHAAKGFVGTAAVKATLLNRAGEQQQVFARESAVKVSAVGAYIYDVDAAVAKAGLLKSVAGEFALGRISVSSGLLSSEMLVKKFPGRLFKVFSVIEWNKKNVARYIKKNALIGASVISRGFPQSAMEIRKRFKLSESSEVFLFFITDEQEKKIVVHAERVYA